MAKKTCASAHGVYSISKTFSCNFFLQLDSRENIGNITRFRESASPLPAATEFNELPFEGWKNHRAVTWKFSVFGETRNPEVS